MGRGSLELTPIGKELTMYKKFSALVQTLWATEPPNMFLDMILFKCVSVTKKCFFKIK